MSYRIRYHPDAKAELQKSRQLYDSRIFSNKFDRWLEALASEAESKDWTLSKDLSELLEKTEDAEELVRQWPTVWQRFWNASFVAKLKAAHLTLTGRVPYRSRGAFRVFPIFSVDCEVTALYLVDHVAGEVIFMAFDGLPMQGYQ
jgi:hypothetical protein